MAIPKITMAEFVLSAPVAAALPPPGIPEAAFVGRSNVGKSSLINCLLNRRNLVRTSSRPGCTQAINFFRVNETWFFVDLPGYGYAKAPAALREKWLALIDAYLETRTSLRVVVLLIDCRRLPGWEEVTLCESLKKLGREVIVVLTKADKLKRGQRARQQAAVVQGLGGVTAEEVVWFSSLNQEGRRELWGRLQRALAG